MHVYDVEPDYVANNGSLGTYACMCCYMHLGLEPSNRFVFGTAVCSSPKSSKDCDSYLACYEVDAFCV